MNFISDENETFMNKLQDAKNSEITKHNNDKPKPLNKNLIMSMDKNLIKLLPDFIEIIKK